MIMVTGPSYQSYGRTDKAIVNYERFLLLYNRMPPAIFPLDSHRCYWPWEDCNQLLQRRLKRLAYFRHVQGKGEAVFCLLEYCSLVVTKMSILIDWVSFELYLLIGCYAQMNFKAFEIWCVVYILWHDWLQFFQIVLRNISFFSQLWRRAIVLFWAFFQIWVPWLRNVVETGAQAIAITCSQTRHDSREAILFLVCNLVTKRLCWGSKQSKFVSKNLHEKRV